MPPDAPYAPSDTWLPRIPSSPSIHPLHPLTPPETLQMAAPLVPQGEKPS